MCASVHCSVFEVCMFKQQSKDEGACSDLAFAALTPAKR